MENNGQATGDERWRSLNDELIDELKRNGHVNDPRIEMAFRSTPRHLFLPGLPLEQVYKDAAIPTKQAGDRPISSSSQPAMMAMMLEQLDLQPGDNVLEIGAGTGYNAALMANVIGEAGLVTTLDIDDDLVEQTKKNLAAAGVEHVQAVRADGGFGYPSAAPYDRIILTTGTSDIAPAWIEQLKPGGILVAPLSLVENGVAKSIAFRKTTDCLESISSKDCAFIMIRGHYAAPVSAPLALGPEPGLNLYVKSATAGALDPHSVYNLLAAPYTDTATGVQVTAGDLSTTFATWLSLQASEDLCAIGTIVAAGEAVDRQPVPFLFGVPGRFRSSFGLIDNQEMALLAQPTNQAAPSIPGSDPSFELYVRTFGGRVRLSGRLRQLVADWDSAGRPPDSDRLKVRAYPKDSTYAARSYELVVEKANSRLVIEW